MPGRYGSRPATDKPARPHGIIDGAAGLPCGSPAIVLDSGQSVHVRTGPMPTDHPEDPEDLTVDRDKPKPRRRPPPRLTPANLRQAVLDYLDRFAASLKRLDQVMSRKIKASAAAHGDDPAALQAALPPILAGLVKQGILNDRELAEARTRSLIRRGGSRTKIRANLAAKGIDAATTALALERMKLEFDDPDLEAAIAYARRRRLGRFRSDPDKAVSQRQKDIAAMARAGFAPALARRALAEPEE